MNNTTGESIREHSSKKHRHRTTSNTSSQQVQHPAQHDPSGEHATGPAGPSTNGHNANQQIIDLRER